MGRSQESFNKKEVRNKKEKKRKEKEKKRLARKENTKGSSFDDMIAFVDEHGNITDTPPDPDKKEEVNVEDIQISVPKGINQEQDVERRGTVTYFNTSKGFGYITDQQTKESIFLHVNNMLEDVREGNAVSFEVEKGQKGPVAVQVKVIRN